MLAKLIALSFRAWLATHSYVVDQVDEGVAALETCDGMVYAPADWLPSGCAREGYWVHEGVCEPPHSYGLTYGTDDGADIKL